jgi:tetratricopeptide (TPR) repeat protein
LLHAVDATRPADSASAVPERAQIEQRLQIARLVPQRSLSGAGATAVEGTLAQVIEAGTGGLQDRTKLAALAAEADHLVARGQFAEVLDTARRMLDLATRCGDDAFAALAHFWFGFIYHFLGEPRKADGYFEWILAQHTPGRWAELRALVGFDLLPHSLTISAINKLSLGYLDEALARSARAVTTAHDLGDQYGLAFASAIGSMTLFLLRSDPRALQERSELCCRHCEKHGFAWWQYYAAAFLGWLIVMRGEPDEGIERMHSAMSAWQATGMLLGPDSLGIVLADAYLEAVRRRPEGNDPLADNGPAGLLTAGLARIDAVLAPNSLCGQCYQAELYRMRGELLLVRDGLAAAGDALDCFRRALVLGLEKGALAWELRAATSLVRLRERQGAAYTTELAEARSYLRGVYARFTEGFSFPDLAEAAALMRDASCERIS